MSRRVKEIYEKKGHLVKYKRTGRMGLHLVHAGGHCLVHLVGFVTFCVFYAGTFLLNAGMRMVFLFCVPVAI
jgi:hypothetical protein